jgi:hypothetical protein
MHTHDQAAGPAVDGIKRVDTDDALGLSFRRSGRDETALFRAADSESVSVDGIEFDAQVAHVARGKQGEVQSWLVHAGTVLTVDGATLFRADGSCDAAASYGLASAAAQVCIQHNGPITVDLRLAERPSTILASPPSQLDRVEPIEFEWSNSTARVSIGSPGETVLWIDPRVDFTSPLSSLELAVADSEGSTSAELETAFADNGEVIAFGELSPREPGSYEIAAEGAKILVQDRWDSEASVRGEGRVEAVLREDAEIFIRYAPDAPPNVRARLKDSCRGQLINLLYNGGFEVGVVDYPPRGWNVQFSRREDVGWPEWTQEDPAEGESCLRFRLSPHRVSLKSRPMRLRTGGRYVLRFQAKGTAEGAAVTVAGQRGTRAEVLIEPGDQWREYLTELNVQPGYCVVSIDWPGGEPDRVLWVDDMEFGYVAQ